jgi:hypothetical protein
MKNGAPNAAADPFRPEHLRPSSPGKSLAPLRPGDAPFVNLLAIPESQPGYMMEAKREIRTSAVRRLQALEQVYRNLVEQAMEIVASARRDLLLHDIPVSATKIRGQTYHLYERLDRDPSRFFSILPPEDYARADPRARYLASYHLSEDSSWARLDGGVEAPWIA